ncbi:MAG: hypothetical protein RLZZ11_1886, partial [Cyanobacteriota bacterium]
MAGMAIAALTTIALIYKIKSDAAVDGASFGYSLLALG